MENLYQLIDRLAGIFLPTAVTNQSFFVNDVPHDLSIDHDPQCISSVIYRIMSTVVYHVKKSSIRLTARRQGQLTVLEIQESGSVNDFAMASALQPVNLLAEKLGGGLSIMLPEKDLTAIVFCFPVATTV